MLPRLGEQFCSETGECALDCDNNKNSREDTRCPLGQIYCLETESCSEKCDKVQTEKRDSEKTCPEGQKLCLATGLCALNCNEETGESGTDTRCPQGQIFCIKSHSCAKSCDEGNDRGLGRITKREVFDCPGINFTNHSDVICSKKLERFSFKTRLSNDLAF